MGSLVDPPEQSSIVHDVPDPVCNLLESDVLVTEGIAEKGLRGVQAESAAVADTTDLHMIGILRRNDPLGIGVRRRLPERCRRRLDEPGRYEVRTALAISSTSSSARSPLAMSSGRLPV